MQNPDAPQSRGTVAAQHARQLRWRWAEDVTTGSKTVYDMIEAACAPDGSGRALLKVRLYGMLAAQPGSSRHGAKVILRKVVALLGMPGHTDLEALTIGWLVDSRTGGRRLAAYLDTTTPLQMPEGFPWARVPYPVPAGGPFPAPTPLPGYLPARIPSPVSVVPAPHPDPWADDEEDPYPPAPAGA